jgi:hypothetical protein
MYLDTALRRTRIFQNTTKRVPITRPTLSVERRFTPSKDSILRLAKNSGDKPFLKHVYLGRRVIKEFYILDDTVQDKHPPHRYLVRMRNGNLEAKIETLGIGKGSAFATIYGKRVVKDLFGPGQIQNLADLEPFNWMRTIREGWELDGFRVAVDHTLFGSWLWGKAIYPQKPFCIGKVELSRNWSTAKLKRLEAQEMDRKLDEFLKQHELTFPDSEGGVYGKSEAFEKWMRDHVEKMCSGSKTTDEWQRRGRYENQSNSVSH